MGEQRLHAPWYRSVLLLLEKFAVPQECPVQVHLAELLQVVHHVLVRELQELQTELVARRLPVAAAAAVVVVDDAEAPRVEVLDEAREDEVGVIADDDLALAGLAEAVAEHGAEALGEDRENDAVAIDGAALHDEGHVRKLLLVGVGPQVAGQGIEGRGGGHAADGRGVRLQHEQVAEVVRPSCPEDEELVAAGREGVPRPPRGAVARRHDAPPVGQHCIRRAARRPVPRPACAAGRRSSFL